MNTIDEETFFCSVCNMPAFTNCNTCDDAICEICCVEDERIVFCYECWTDREKELERDEEDTA